MDITLSKATVSDCEELYSMQKRAFQPLLEKYRDYGYSPAAEKVERTLQRLQEPVTDYYWIALNGTHIGAVRICRFDGLCKLKQLYILPEYQGNGYAQQAIRLVEALYPDARRWELDTILQEDKLCHLYEKMGYHKTGQQRRLKEGMDLVFYAKDKAGLR